MSNKPFIKLFENFGKKYLYDVNRNVLLSINEEEYDILCNELRIWNEEKSFHDIMRNSVLKKLYDAKFLQSNKITKIIHPADKNLEYYLKNKLRMVTLQVTQQCNLRCDYCVYSDNYKNRNHTNKKMTYEDAKRNIDFLMSHSRDQSVVFIGFYGGEPLLNFDLIKKSILYAKERYSGKLINFNLTTNGTLINDEIINFFQEHDVMILISLDGPKEIHDKHRKFHNSKSSTFDRVMQNFEHIRENYPDFVKNIAFNTVLDPENDLKCNFDFFYSFEEIYDLENKFTSTFEAENQEKLVAKENADNDSIEKFNIIWEYEIFKLYLSKLRNNKSLYRNVSPLVKSIYNDVKRLHSQLNYSPQDLTETHHAGPCLPGVLRFLINVDGDFFPCERCNEKSDMMKIGNIKQGFNLENIRNILNIGKISEEKCKNCWAIRFCYLCATFADNEKDFSFMKKTNKCAEVRKRSEERLKNYCTLKELNHDFIDLEILNHEMLDRI
jgi:uncharacterized protein